MVERMVRDRSRSKRGETHIHGHQLVLLGLHLSLDLFPLFGEMVNAAELGMFGLKSNYFCRCRFEGILCM